MRSGPAARGKKFSSKVMDELRFLRCWAGNPAITGAVRPSGHRLARRMAQQIELDRTGPVVELGPGTGVVTEAILEIGVEQRDLTAIEYNGKFCELLRKRYKEANIVRGDAYSLKDTLPQFPSGSLAGIVSSLPIINSSVEKRRLLLLEAIELLQPDAPFIQFSYSFIPPMKEEPNYFRQTRTGWILMNVPPARVWIFRNPARPEFPKARRL